MDVNVTTAARRRPRIFYGWWIVIAAALMNTYGAGIWFYGFPIFFKEILSEFGWGRAITAGAVSFSRLEGGPQAPLIGWLVDRFGPRGLAIIGAIIAGVGFIAMGFIYDFTLGPVHISALVLFYALYAGVISVGYNTGFSHATMAAVANWFVEKRSRAFAIFSLGAGGSGATVAVLGLVVNAYGWRTGAILAGLGIFAIVIPLALVMRHRPEQYGYLPDGKDPASEPGPTPAPEDVPPEPMSAQSQDVRYLGRVRHFREHDFTVKQALVTVGFWMLVLGLTGRSITMTAVVLHEIAYLTDVGIPEVRASMALGAMVLVSLVGRMSFGTLGDYIDKRYVFIASILLQAFGIFLLDRVTTMTDVWIFVAVYGVSYGGAIPIQLAIVGEYYGRRYYATIRGFMQLFLMPATVLGPVYAGWVFDVTGSYHWAFMSFIAALVVSTVFIFFARRPDPPQESLPAEGGPMGEQLGSQVSNTDRPS